MLDAALLKRIEVLEKKLEHFTDWQTYRSLVRIAHENGDWDMLQEAEQFAERKGL